MACRTGVLSDAHSDQFCLEFSSAPMGYYQSNYQELPPNPNLTGIKTPRYVQTVQKPQSLDIAAINLGKLLHKNTHLSSTFILENMAKEVANYVPPHVNLTPSIGTQQTQANYINLISIVGASRGQQFFAQVSGTSSTGSAPAPPSVNGSAPHSGDSSVSENDADVYTGGVRSRQTAQAQEQAEVFAAGRSTLFGDDDELDRQSTEFLEEIQEGRMSSPRRNFSRSLAFARTNRTPEQRASQIERRIERRMSQSAIQADELNTANEADSRFPISRHSDGTMSGGPPR